MAPTKNKRSKSVQGPQMDLKSYLNWDYAKKLLLDPHYLRPTCLVLFIFEVVLNTFIIERVNYTEIDWKAYMQEVEGFLNGSWNYSELRGDTGPLVYPAGFVYIYTFFYTITSQGTNIHLAQYLFLIIYLAQIALVYRIFEKTAKIPPYALIISTLTSYRIHSIYVLRLFNDPIAVLLFYLSLNLFMSNRWRLGSLVYSLAVSVKMNILLYAPCLLIAYLTSLGLKETILNLTICGLVQLILGLPFLYGNCLSYIKGSFDLGRVFEHKWTVNYRFLSREIFESRYLHISLLLFHLLLLGVFTPIFKRYLTSYAKLNIITEQVSAQIRIEKRKRLKEKEKLSKKEREFLKNYENQLKQGGNTSSRNDDGDVFSENSKFEEKMGKIHRLFVLPFFVCNVIGMACARSLHYQFYCWYFHSLVYLVFCTSYKKPLMFLLLGIIEYCWNVYPSTVLSSALLHVCHITLIIGLYKSMRL